MATETTAQKAPRLPPQWFMRWFWRNHRRVYRVTGGRFGLWRPTDQRWGAMRVRAVGRRSGEERPVMVGYFEDGENLVVMAMNGWRAPDPQWWLNVQAHPDVVVDTKDGPRDVHARAAAGEEWDRLWARWCAYDGNLDAVAARRPGGTAIVVFEPR
ncbi:MAG: nitroreductase/quinone reductase family protein [Acidimicrobiia bacterium]